MFTELQASIAVKTARVIPMVLDHRCCPANTSNAKLAVELQSKLVFSIYDCSVLKSVMDNINIVYNPLSINMSYRLVYINLMEKMQSVKKKIFFKSERF